MSVIISESLANRLAGRLSRQTEHYSYRYTSHCNSIQSFDCMPTLAGSSLYVADSVLCDLVAGTIISATLAC